MQRQHEIQVGVTVLAALAVLILGVSWLKDLSIQRSVNTWTVTFPQTGGLGASDEVQVNGIRKGAVRSMELVGDRVYVKLALADDVMLTTDSQVAIRNVGLMGEKVIAVDLSATGTPYTERDTIPGIYELGMAEVMASVGDAVSTVSDLSRQLSTVAQALSGQGDVSGKMPNIQATTNELRLMVEENRRSIKVTLDNMEASSQTVRGLTAGREAKLGKAVDDFSTTMARMDVMTARLDSLTKSLNSVATKVDRGDGTLGKLINQDELYKDLNASVASLRVLIADIKKNPKDYFRFSIF
jgi:phospholipid/cholesterol/gamma-HCH transport system substrate-binding protein